MATFDTAQLILVNLEEAVLNCLRTSFDDKDMRTLHNTASNSPVWTHLVNRDHVWSRRYSMNDFGHIKVEERELGLRFQVKAGMAL